MRKVQWLFWNWYLWLWFCRMTPEENNALLNDMLRMEMTCAIKEMRSLISEHREQMQAYDRQHQEMQNVQRASVQYEGSYPETQQQSQRPDARNNKKRWNRNRKRNRQSKGKVERLPMVKCPRCRRKHELKDCPQVTGTCFKCQQHGHLAAKCPQKAQPSLCQPGLSQDGPSRQNLKEKGSQLRLNLEGDQPREDWTWWWTPSYLLKMCTWKRLGKTFCIIGKFCNSALLEVVRKYVLNA